MSKIASFVAANWQRSLPFLTIIGTVAWFAAFRDDPASERAVFAGMLVVYMAHQIEEHLWPGGFRQFANAHVFKSGRDDWPVTVAGVALINIGFVWLPIAAAALFPNGLRWIGLGWIGLTFVNALSHIATSIRFRSYNPGLVTSIALFLPFTVWALAREVAEGVLSGAGVAAALGAGALLHVPVAALFVVPYMREKRAAG